MKRGFYFLLMALFLLLSMSCGCTKGLHHQGKEPDTIPTELKPETICIENTTKLDSVFKVLKEKQDSIDMLRDSMVYYRDTTEYINYINARRIEKIKYYINICEKRPANKQYFFGWIRRTMSEE